jgi:four helix bundle protein
MGDKEVNKESLKTHEDLVVYQKAFEAAMKIFNLSKTFPVEERSSLTDQIRRSSRSVCANLAEAWRKRRSEAAFKAKLSDCEAEAAPNSSLAQVRCEMSISRSRTSKRTIWNLQPNLKRISKHDQQF